MRIDLVAKERICSKELRVVTRLEEVCLNLEKYWILGGTGRGSVDTRPTTDPNAHAPGLSFSYRALDLRYLQLNRACSSATTAFADPSS